MVGVLYGLSQKGVDLSTADRMIGTSAGSFVAAQIGREPSLAASFALQMTPSKRERSPRVDWLTLLRYIIPILLKLNDPIERARRIGFMAVSAKTMDERSRRAVLAAYLPHAAWPERDITIVAVDTQTGEAALFDRTSGVDLIDAIGASCAVPLVWPPVTIQGRRFMDGGLRSTDNADLAKGSATIVVLSPVGFVLPKSKLAAQVRDLERAGAKVRVISPDLASRKAFGRNPLAAETRQPSARAGLAQGRAMAAELQGFWNAPGH
jgi:NTE family protein